MALFGHLSSTSNNRAEAPGVLGALEWIWPRALEASDRLAVRRGGASEGGNRIRLERPAHAFVDTTRLVGELQAGADQPILVLQDSSLVAYLVSPRQWDVLQAETKHLKAPKIASCTRTCSRPPRTSRRAGSTTTSRT